MWLGSQEHRTKPKQPLRLPYFARLTSTLSTRNKAYIEVHANRCGIPDQGSHVGVFRFALGSAELRSTGPDLLGNLGLSKPLLPPLIRQRQTNLQYLRLSSYAFLTAGLRSSFFT